MDTLVLNMGWQPVGRMSWQRAITQWCKGRVEIIDSYEDRDIRSVTFSMKMPAVVRELTKYKRKKAVKFSRENVYARDTGRCQYCQERVSRPKATYDHVVPRDQGGKTTWDNIVIACFDCNQKKRNRTPEQAGMLLKKKPIKPKTLSNDMNFTFTWKKGMPIEWQAFLRDSVYWNGALDEDD